MIERTLAGDQRAFEALMHRYRAPLFQAVYHILGDQHEVHDVLQQVFLHLYLSLPTLSPDRPLRPWLLRVAHNCSVDHLRRKRVTLFSEIESVSDEDGVPVLIAILDPNPMPEEVAERRDLQQRIQRAIRALPSRFRSVVLLRYEAQLSYAEIGQMLSLTESTARTYFQRAKPLLRVVLARQV